MSINPDIIEFEKLIKTKIGNSRNFKWYEALLQEHWKIYAIPEHAILENIVKSAEVMDKIRTFFDKPVIISSWYRCDAYNKFINGSVNSAHKLGLAVDFLIYGLPCDKARNALLTHSKLEEFNICMEKLPGSRWVHIDLMPPRKNGGRYFNP